MPSRLLLATACIDGVLEVITRSKSPPVTCLAMAIPVGMSPCALNRCDYDPVAVAIAALRQPVEHAAHPVVEHRRGGVLHDGDALGRLAGTAAVRCPRSANKQDRGRQPDQEHAERQPFEDVEHREAALDLRAWKRRVST